MTQYTADVADLRSRFEQFGDIKNFFNLVEKRGMVFVTYFDVRAASEAKRGMQGFQVFNRGIDVHYSLPRPDEAAGKCGPDKNQGSIRAVVEGLRGPLVEASLAQQLSYYGEISTIFQPMSAPPNERIIEFYDMRATEDAINGLQGSPFLGGTLRLDWAWDATPDTEFAPVAPPAAIPPQVPAAPAYGDPYRDPYREYPPPSREHMQSPASGPMYGGNPYSRPPPSMGAYDGYGPPQNPRDSRDARDYRAPTDYRDYPPQRARYEDDRYYRGPPPANPYSRDRPPYSSAPGSKPPVSDSNQIQSLLATLGNVPPAGAHPPPSAADASRYGPPAAYPPSAGGSSSAYGRVHHSVSPPPPANSSAPSIPPAVMNLLGQQPASGSTASPPSAAGPPPNSADVSSLLALLAQQNERR